MVIDPVVIREGQGDIEAEDWDSAVRHKDSEARADAGARDSRSSK